VAQREQARNNFEELPFGISVRLMSAPEGITPIQFWESASSGSLKAIYNQTEQVNDKMALK